MKKKSKSPASQKRPLRSRADYFTWKDSDIVFVDEKPTKKKPLKKTAKKKLKATKAKKKAKSSVK
ncbi:MAG: hypothetical protein Q8M02_12985 [Candidatus Didemnitutus sp.]|nr:hypothetical protein [Candidatus Didemnitutus sp.]